MHPTRVKALYVVKQCGEMSRSEIARRVGVGTRHARAVAKALTAQRYFSERIEVRRGPGKPSRRLWKRTKRELPEHELDEKRLRAASDVTASRGWKLNPVFEEAVKQLADHVALTLTPVPLVKEFRVAVIMKYLGEKVSALDTAKHLEIPKNAAERYIAAIRKCIRDLEKNGLTAFSERFDEVGILIRKT